MKDLTQRESKALKVLEEAMGAAWTARGYGIDSTAIVKRFRIRMLNAIRYTGKPRVAAGRKSYAASRANPGATVKVGYYIRTESDREGT